MSVLLLNIKGGIILNKDFLKKIVSLLIVIPIFFIIMMFFSLLKYSSTIIEGGFTSADFSLFNYEFILIGCLTFQLVLYLSFRILIHKYEHKINIIENNMIIDIKKVFKEYIKFLFMKNNQKITALDMNKIDKDITSFLLKIKSGDVIAEK